MKIYLVQVGSHVSQLAYTTLEEAQAFIETRVWDKERINKANPYYSEVGRDGQIYTIIDVVVEGVKSE